MDTYASNPGYVKVHWPTYIKHNPGYAAAWAAVFLTGLGILIGTGFSKEGVGMGLSLTIAMVWMAFGMTKHWKGGDVNPGIVISLKPFRIAVLADLSMHPDQFDVPAVKIIGKPKPSGDVKVGDRFATRAKPPDAKSAAPIT